MVFKNKIIDSLSNEYLEKILNTLHWDEQNKEDRRIFQVARLDELKKTHVLLTYIMKNTSIWIGQWKYVTGTLRIERTHKTKTRPITFKEKFFT